MERATESTDTPITEYASPFFRPIETHEPLSPADQLTEWIIMLAFRTSEVERTLLEVKETMAIRQHVKDLLSDELDEDFPADLGKEFWETMEKIAVVWHEGLRDKVIKSLQDKGFSVEWFKWGHSSGFPVLVAKLRPTPEPEKVWDITDHIEQIIDGAIECGVACIIHP